MNRPEVVTICTSYKFIDDIIPLFKQLTDSGKIVLLPAFLGDVHEKEWYMGLHKEKIKMSDYIVVINRECYIGESVRKEITYAIEQCKPVYYAIPVEHDDGAYTIQLFCK